MEQAVTTDCGALNDELYLAPEDFQKLQLLKEVALEGIHHAKEAMPDKIKKLILHVTVTSKLQDDKPDQLEITTTFNLMRTSGLFQFTLLPQTVFYVNCLDEHLEDVVAKKFTDESREFIESFYKFIRDYADDMGSFIAPPA